MRDHWRDITYRDSVGVRYLPAAPYTGTDGRAVVLAIWSGQPDCYRQVKNHIYIDSQWLLHHYPARTAEIVRQAHRPARGLPAPTRRKDR